MHPLLFQIGPIPIHTYGALIALGFLAALAVIRYFSPREGLDVESMIDLTFLCLISGFLGARILFIITRLSDFTAAPLDVFKVWEGGLVFYGGPLAALPIVFWYCHRKKLNLWKVCDVFAPALTIGHVFGRLGCFAAGCCYGKPTDSVLGVKFYSPLIERSMQGVPLHPTQLYESFSLSILFAGLIYVLKHKRFDGHVMFVYLMAYPLIRSIIETFRGDLIRGFVIDGVLSTSQFISVFVFLAATAGLVWRLRQLHSVQSSHKEIRV